MGVIIFHTHLLMSLVIKKSLILAASVISLSFFTGEKCLSPIASLFSLLKEIVVEKSHILERKSTTFPFFGVYLIAANICFSPKKAFQKLKIVKNRLF